MQEWALHFDSDAIAKSQKPTGVREVVRHRQLVAWFSRKVLAGQLDSDVGELEGGVACDRP